VLLNQLSGQGGVAGTYGVDQRLVCLGFEPLFLLQPIADSPASLILDRKKRVNNLPQQLLQPEIAAKRPQELMEFEIERDMFFQVQRLAQTLRVPSQPAYGFVVKPLNSQSDGCRFEQASCS
jgi:hypothetical protein